MKSSLKKLSLLSLGLLLYGCNEKISPELQEGNSTTVPPTITPSEYYFRVTNNSATVLNYVLHRSGNGNRSADCEVSTTTALSNTLYVGDAATAFDSKSYDVACFFEAEELALMFNGLSFKMEASANTCEYTAYTPYSYFDSIPGSSGTTYVGITCDTANGITNAMGNVHATAIGAVYGAGNTPVDCGYMVDINPDLAVADRVPRLIPDQLQRLCSFDYATNGGGNGQNCDTGRISFQLYNVYNAATDPADPVDPQRVAVDQDDHVCGGSIASCVQGAIRAENDAAAYSYFTTVYNTTLNQSFERTYTLPEYMGVRGNAVDIVNYRRGLASLNLNFIDYDESNASEWGDTTNNEAFDPSIMDKFSNNRRPDNGVIIDTTGLAPTSIVDYTAYTTQRFVNGYTATPYAAEPFLGLNGARISPFYTFYCLDRAFEIKARIRMVVRDWDRVFPSDNADLELLSDAFKTITARRQDLPADEEEIPDDASPMNYQDDVPDWDALVLMDRTDTGGLSYSAWQTANPGMYVGWSPTDGWWDPTIFTNQGPAGGN